MAVFVDITFTDNSGHYQVCVGPIKWRSSAENLIVLVERLMQSTNSSGTITQGVSTRDLSEVRSSLELGYFLIFLLTFVLEYEINNLRQMS